MRVEVKQVVPSEGPSQDLAGSQTELKRGTPGLLHHQCLQPPLGGGAQREVLVEYSEVE